MKPVNCSASGTPSFNQNALGKVMYTYAFVTINNYSGVV